MKYIFLPGLNDDSENIDGFLSIVEKIRPQSVFISRDTHNMINLPEHTLEKIKFVISELRKRAVEVTLRKHILLEDDYNKVVL